MSVLTTVFTTGQIMPSGLIVRQQRYRSVPVTSDHNPKTTEESRYNAHLHKTGVSQVSTFYLYLSSSSMIDFFD